MEAYVPVLTSATWTHVQKGLLPPAQNSGGIEESSRCWAFFVPRPQFGVLANKTGGGIKAIYCLHSRQFGVFWMWLHALWDVQCTSHVSETDAKLHQWVKPHLLPFYLDNIIIFLQMAEEHLHRMGVVFDLFREYNLKLKPSKCSLFKEEINYLAHWVSKEDVQPSDLNLRGIVKCTSPQTYTEIQAFLGLMGHYWQFIKGFMHITQPLNELLSGEGASRKSEKVLLPEHALRAFNALKQVCMSTPVLAFADYTKEFLIETDASKKGGSTLPKQADVQYHPVTYGSWALTAHKKNYHSTKLEFLALKWVVTEHFKEYLLYPPFLVRTDNNPLTYIMTIPNLNTTGHWWVGALVKFNFQLE